MLVLLVSELFNSNQIPLLRDTAQTSWVSLKPTKLNTCMH